MPLDPSSAPGSRAMESSIENGRGEGPTVPVTLSLPTNLGLVEAQPEEVATPGLEWC